MLGQLGEVSVASVGLANQIFFLMTLMLFGTYSGVGVFTAQFWGKHDLPNVRKVMGIGLMIGLTEVSCSRSWPWLSPVLRCVTTRPILR